MSDRQPQSSDDDIGIPDAGPAGPDMPAPGEPVTTVAEVEGARLAPEQEETSPKPDAPKVEAVGMEAPKLEASEGGAPRSDPVEAIASRFPGNITIMSPGDRPGADAKAAPAEASSRKRHLRAVAAVVALATVAGAFGGALATAGIGKLMAGERAAVAAPVPAKENVLEASVARIDADIAALKASIEHAVNAGTSQYNKASERLDKVEKAQAEPAAKLAKLSETADKLRAAQVSTTTAAAVPAAAKDVIASMPQQAVAALTPLPSSKPGIARLPIVEGWILRDVANGSALIESRRGIYEVYVGDPVPNLGRVDAIRRQDGRWVVVTSKGLIVAR